MSTNKQRRNFIKTMGLGTVALSAPLAGLSAKEKKEGLSKSSSTENLFNGFEIAFETTGDFMQGIGAVKVNGIALRSNRLPMFCQISTPEAIELVNYKLKNKTSAPDLLQLDFEVQKQLGDTMEWMLHTVRNRRNMADWTKEPEAAPGTVVSLILKPAERKLGNVMAKGFSYQYTFKSKELAIYKITDRATWEIGAKATGNELWMRNGVVECIKAFAQPDDFYSTEWYLPNIANPNIFQFHPLQTQLQGFTFTSAKEGTLITWATELSHIRSLFEKWRGYNEIVHFHEHCNDLAGEFKTSPMEVLWVPGELDQVGRANLYNHVRELVHEELHRQAGLRRERITTYGVIEEWTEPDFDRYREKGLSKLMDAGVKTVFIANQCQNDMNTWGLSNMCCNVDFKISETVGEDKLKKFCQAAKAGGVKVQMWGNTAVSTTTERFMHRDGRKKGIEFLPFKDSIQEVIAKAESPFIRNASNAIEADHYTPRFCALNLRDKDICDYWLKQWKYFHDEIGIEGIFLDSSFNMSSDKFHHAQWDGTRGWGGATLDQKGVTGKYRPANEPPKLIHTQYFAHLNLIAQMQKDGYHYCGEDMGVFGINRTGPDLIERIPSLPLWADCFCDFDEKVVKEAGFEPMDIFFKGLAYRMMWKIYWNIRQDKLYLGTENPFAFKMIKIFNQVNDFLYDREILAGENGILYTKDNTSVLWAFTNFDFKLNSSAKVKNLVSGKDFTGKSIKAEKNNVYLIVK